MEELRWSHVWTQKHKLLKMFGFFLMLQGHNLTFFSILMTVSLNINADLFLKLKNTAKIAHKLVQSVSIKIQRLSVLKIFKCFKRSMPKEGRKQEG